MVLTHHDGRREGIKEGGQLMVLDVTHHHVDLGGRAELARSGRHLCQLCDCQMWQSINLKIYKRRHISESITSLQREQQDEKATGNTAEKLKKINCISLKDTREEKAPRFFCNHSPLLFDLQPRSAGLEKDSVVCLNHLYWSHIIKPTMYNKQS